MPRARRQITDARVQLPLAGAVVRLLWRRLGTGMTVRALVALVVARLRGEPWRPFPPAVSEKDRLAREEIRDVVLLYRFLRPRLGEADALAVLGGVVTMGAFRTFDYLLDPLDPEAMKSLPAEERAAFVQANIDRFPNAEARIEHAAPECVAFTVTACRFPVLVQAVGHPELAPLFCAADHAYFARRKVRLERPHTIAEGAGSCPFTLYSEDTGEMRAGDKRDGEKALHPNEA